MIYSNLFLGHVLGSKFLETLKTGTITIDNSEYSTWSSCFPMGLYNGALKRVGARSRAPLAFGGAVHAGLDTYFKGLPGWRQAALEDAEKTQLDSLGDPKRNTDKLINLLECYFLDYERKPAMQFKILELAGVKQVEQSFVVPLGIIQLSREEALRLGCPETITVMWSGKIDLITLYEVGIAPADHKTTTVMGDKFIDDKIRSNQMLGYTYAGKYLSEHLFGNLPVFGCRINALAMRSAGYEFKQFDIPYPDWKVAEWQEETLGAIKTLVGHLSTFITTKVANPTREHCVTKYGKCPYFDVCDSLPQMRDRMIFDDNYYFISDWSPLNE